MYLHYEIHMQCIAHITTSQLTCLRHYKVLSWEPYSSAFAAMSPTLLVAPAPLRREKCQLEESLGRAASKACDHVH